MTDAPLERPDDGSAATVPASAAPTVVDAAPPRPRLAYWLILAIIVFDQITKWLVVRGLPLYDSVTVIPGLLDLVHIRNAGVAFGIFNDSEHPLRQIGTTALALVALAGIGYYAMQTAAHERWTRLGLSLVMGGAIGNLVDRARQGYVVDFVDVYVKDWHFWAFNVADSAISVGALLMVIDLFRPNAHVSNPV